MRYGRFFEYSRVDDDVYKECNDILSTIECLKKSIQKANKACEFREYLVDSSVPGNGTFEEEVQANYDGINVNIEFRKIYAAGGDGFIFGEFWATTLVIPRRHYGIVRALQEACTKYAKKIPYLLYTDLTACSKNDQGGYVQPDVSIAIAHVDENLQNAESADAIFGARVLMEVEKHNRDVLQQINLMKGWMTILPQVQFGISFKLCYVGSYNECAAIAIVHQRSDTKTIKCNAICDFGTRNFPLPWQKLLKQTYPNQFAAKITKRAMYNNANEIIVPKPTESNYIEISIPSHQICTQLNPPTLHHFEQSNQSAICLQINLHQLVQAFVHTQPQRRQKPYVFPAPKPLPDANEATTQTSTQLPKSKRSRKAKQATGSEQTPSSTETLSKSSNSSSRKTRSKSQNPN